MAMKPAEISSDHLCPCGTGKTYGKCCKRKAFKWKVDDDGQYHKVIPLTDEARAMLEYAAKEFERIFERKQRDNDPVFLFKYLLSDAELSRLTTETLQRAGVSAAIIYAYEKTGGLLASKDNLRFMTKKDEQDWENAIDEYYELSNKPSPPDPLAILFASLEDELDNCIICFGYVLEYGRAKRPKRRPSSSKFFSVDDYVLVCVAKSVKTLRAIKVLLEQNIGADCLPLARHVLENYFHIVLALGQPNQLKHVIDGPIGIRLGTHEFARGKNGRIDSRRIIDKKSGEELIGNFSYLKMAACSPNGHDSELYEYMYSFLSDFTHPSLQSIALVLGAEGEIDPLTNEMQTEAMFYSVCFAALVLDQLRHVSLFSTQAKKDIRTVVSRIARAAIILIDIHFNETVTSDSFAVIKARLSSIVDNKSARPQR